VGDRGHASLPFDRTFEAWLGLTVVRIELYEVVATIDVREELLDHKGRLHGGVFTTLAETTASMGTSAVVTPRGGVGHGVSNSTTFLAEVSSGRVIGVARCATIKPDLWTWSVEMRDEAGIACALSTVVVAVCTIPRWEGSPLLD
jgi:1,4-dihydroxy-2-naphthoyl-CoA hydrolase